MSKYHKAPKYLEQIKDKDSCCIGEAKLDDVPELMEKLRTDGSKTADKIYQDWLDFNIDKAYPLES